VKHVVHVDVRATRARAGRPVACLLSNQHRSPPSGISCSGEKGRDCRVAQVCEKLKVDSGRCPRWSRDSGPLRIVQYLIWNAQIKDNGAAFASTSPRPR